MNTQAIILIVFISIFLMSCASNPPSQLLSEAEQKYESALEISNIKNSDAQSIGDAKDALDKAKELQANNKAKYLVDHYALVSIKNTEIAEARHRLNQIERETEQAKEKRQQILMANKTQELRDAKMEAMQLASQIDALKAQQTERGIIMTLENIVFAFNSATLQPGGEMTVRRIARYLNNYPDRNVLIEGFTDNVGSEEYNLKLSRERAESVKHSLIRHGVGPHRINTVGLGEAYPVAPNTNEAGRQQNRRVEIVISNEDGEPVLTR